MIFLDVGAHRGQTLDEVTKPGYDFERLIAFEPMPREFATLCERFGDLDRVTLLNLGLGQRAGIVDLYGDNERMEASIWPTKNDVDPSVVTPCIILAASSFFECVPDGLIVKLNCEGAEIPILNDLIDSGDIWKIRNVMIDFDIRKVTGHEHDEADLLARFARIGFDRYSLCDDVMVGATHQDRIANWLAGVL